MSLIVLFTFPPRSSAKLSYLDAQNVIDGKTLGDVPVILEHEAGDISHDIRVLFDLAKHIRRERVRNGALKVDSPRLRFQLDDNGLPLDCGEYELYDANDLIEEVSKRWSRTGDLTDTPRQFMLLANISVAQHIAVHLPEQALLRRHDSPLERRLVRGDVLLYRYIH